MIDVFGGRVLKDTGVAKSNNSLLFVRYRTPMQLMGGNRLKMRPIWCDSVFGVRKHQ